MLIREVMTSSVVSAPPGCPVRQVAELMRERNVGSVVLVDEGRPVGFVTDRDLAVSVLADGREHTDPVETYASSPVVTAEARMEVEEAASLMIQNGIRRLPVMDDGRMVGILTLDDLVVRTGDASLTQSVTTDLMRASMPDFYFFDRGG